jgi:hypothetical protein
MKDGGVWKGTAGRTAPLVDVPFRRCSSGMLNGLRRIANRHKKKPGIHDDTRSKVAGA